MSNASRDEGLSEERPLRPAQRQRRQPGIESRMHPRPVSITDRHRGSGKLDRRVALITGGDSGIGRAVALAFAREGADVCIVYLDEHGDAEETARMIEDEGRRAMMLARDVRDRDECADAIEECVEVLGGLDVLVNNAAVQYEHQRIDDIPHEHLLDTVATNLLGTIYMTQAAVPHLRRSRGSIIVTTSVTAYRGSPHLADYAATKGALVALTRSLSQQLVGDGVRVNAVAPGPIWTPLIAASFDKEKVQTFGSDVPMGRAGEPAECAGAYVFLASDAASYVTGQVIHVNGGEIVNA